LNGGAIDREGESPKEEKDMERGGEEKRVQNAPERLVFVAPEEVHHPQPGNASKLLRET